MLVDGERVGTAPLSEPVLVEVGAHSVQVKKGDLSDTQSVAPVAGQLLSARFTIAAAAVPSPAPVPVAPPPPVESTAPAAPVPANPRNAEGPAPPTPAPVQTPPPLSEQELPNLPVHDAPPQPKMALWPAYLGYGLMAPAVAVSLFVGFKSVSDARTNANVTGSNIVRAMGSCPTTSPRFVGACSSYQNDLNLVATDKTIAYSTAAGAGVLFIASTAYLVVAFSHNAHREEVAPPPGAITVAPVVGVSTRGISIAVAF